MNATDKITMLSKANSLFDELAAESDPIRKIDIMLSLSSLLQELSQKAITTTLNYGNSSNPFPKWVTDNEAGLAGNIVRECIYVRKDNFALYLSSKEGLSGKKESGWDFARFRMDPVPCKFSLPFKGFTNNLNLDPKTRRQAYAALNRSIALVNKTLPLVIGDWKIDLHDTGRINYKLTKEDQSLYLQLPLRDVIKAIETGEISQYVEKNRLDSNERDRKLKLKVAQEKEAMNKGNYAFDYVSDNTFQPLSKIIKTDFIDENFNYQKSYVAKAIDILTNINVSRFKLTEDQTRQLNNQLPLIRSEDFWLRIEYKQLIDQNSKFLIKD
ncbi:hypothetical protein [Aliivibrio salmonicida]|uniref:hypothetical protein n=1 Tax=Aliivibrio salmonicida TaxID=40269 RepID=UPI003D0B0F55